MSAGHFRAGFWDKMSVSLTFRANISRKSEIVPLWQDGCRFGAGEARSPGEDDDAIRGEEPEVAGLVARDVDELARQAVARAEDLPLVGLVDEPS